MNDDVLFCCGEIKRHTLLPPPPPPPRQSQRSPSFHVAALANMIWPICFAVIATVLLTSEARGEPKFHNVAYKNTRPKTANAPYDIHDGPIIQTGDNEFYRYAMAYTKCYLRGTPGSFNETKHKLFASFVQTMHRTGFDCSQIVLGTFAGATGTWGEDCGFKTPKWGQTVNVYKSADLVHWELVQDALQGRQARPPPRRFASFGRVRPRPGALAPSVWGPAPSRAEPAMPPRDLARRRYLARAD